MTTCTVHMTMLEASSGSIYMNVFGSVLILKLGWRNRFSGEAADRVLSGAVEETVEHFVMEFGGLSRTRERYRIDENISVEEVLLSEGKTEERVKRYTKMLHEMWTERSRQTELIVGTYVL